MSTTAITWLPAWPRTPAAPAPAIAWAGWLADCRAAHADDVGPTGQDRADALGRPTALRASFLRRRALLRRFVATLTETTIDKVSVANDGGRPIIIAPAGFTVSSAGRHGALAFALSRNPVGVDVEMVDEVHDLAWAVLDREERRRLNAVADREERWRAFLAVWAAKEAYLKAIGLGLARSPETIRVDFAPSGAVAAFQVRDPRATAPILSAEQATLAGGRLQAACVTLAPPP